MNATTRDNWTPDRIETLTKLWAEGKSCSQIAILMGGGITRNSVIGKVTRLKLPKHGLNHTPTPRHRPPQRKAKSPTARKTANLQPGPRLEKDVTRQPLTGDACLFENELRMRESEGGDGVDVTNLLGILALTADTCRYPIGDPRVDGFGFCGHQTAPERVYCQSHYDRTHQRRLGVA